MEDQKKLLQFVTWLGENVPELKGQAPEQIVSTINKLSESKEGQQMLQGLIEEFESSMTSMFKKGGKLAYLLCLKEGGNIQDCGCGKKIEKAEDGRVLGSNQYPRVSRKEAIDVAMDAGMTKEEAQRAYLNQKNGLRRNGITGNKMRQHARWNVIDSVYPRAKEEPQVVSQQTPQIPVLDTNIEIEDIPIEINDTFIPLDKPINVQKIDKFSGSFDDAFAAARRSKLDSFVWDNPNAQYDRYSTQLGKTTPSAQQSAQQQEYEYNQQLVENAVNSPKLKDKVKSGIISTLNYPMK